MLKLNQKQSDFEIKKANKLIEKCEKLLEFEDYNEVITQFNRIDKILQELFRNSVYDDIFTRIKITELREKIYHKTLKKGLFMNNKFDSGELMIHLDNGETIFQYFKGNQIFVGYLKKNYKVLRFIYEMMRIQDAMCGLSYDNMIEIIKKTKTFKFIKTKKINQFTDTISKYKSAIVMIEMDKNGTLDEGLKILESHFKELNCVYQFWANQNKETKITFLLLR